MRRQEPRAHGTAHGPVPGRVGVRCQLRTGGGRGEVRYGGDGHLHGDPAASAALFYLEEVGGPNPRNRAVC